jgi:hypothetical protein
MLRTSSSSSQLAQKPAKVLPTRSEDYELLEEIGQGVSAKASLPPKSLPPSLVYLVVLQVWRAKCKPLDEVVAIKILDLERQDPGKLVRQHTAFSDLLQVRSAITSPDTRRRFVKRRKR